MVVVVKSIFFLTSSSRWAKKAWQFKVLPLND